MNRSYGKNEHCHSDFGIFDDVCVPSEARTGKLKKATEMLLCKLAMLLRILCSGTVHRLAKAGAVALCLIGMIGIAGAIEVGNLSLTAGLGICALLLLAEFFLLRNRKR